MIFPFFNFLKNWFKPSVKAAPNKEGELAFRAEPPVFMISFGRIVWSNCYVSF